MMNYINNYWTAPRLFKNDASDVISHDQEHECKEQADTNEMNHAFLLRVDSFSSDCFYDQEYQSASIQCWNWKQIHYAQICAEQDAPVEHIEEGIKEAILLSRLLVGFSYRLNNSYRSCHIIDGEHAAYDAF